MTWMPLFLLVGGLVTLTAGAEALVRGASRLAAALGIPPLVVGLTVVAFGTSSPEMAVSVISALKGQPDIAMGNVVGSNIINILLVLGASALIAPMVVTRQLVRIEVPVMIGVSALMWLLALNGNVARWEGAVLFGGLVCYTVFQILLARRERSLAVHAQMQEGFATAQGGRRLAANILLAAAGLGLLICGSRWFVSGAVDLARRLGIDELVVGLTVVALGTSLPEVATSIVAALRGERDLAVGNVVGSNIFNILAVLGLTALTAPAGGVPVASGLLNADIPFMLVLTVACLPIFLTGHLIARWEGGLFLFYYLAYTGFLVLTATGHAALDRYQTILFFYIAPLTAVTLAVSVAREVRAHIRPQRLPVAPESREDGKGDPPD